MSILVVGSVAFDNIATPSGSVENVLGGAATHFALAASFFTEVRVVAVVGDDDVGRPEGGGRLVGHPVTMEVEDAAVDGVVEHGLAGLVAGDFGLPPEEFALWFGVLCPWRMVFPCFCYAQSGSRAFVSRSRGRPNAPVERLKM